MNSGSTPPLEGLKVLEFSEYEGVQYCGRTLAAMGADVVKLESLEGDPLRRRPPFAATLVRSAEKPLRSLRLLAGAPDAGSAPGRSMTAAISIPFEYLNEGKRGVTANLSSDTGAERLRELVGWADVVLVSPETRGYLDAVATRPGQVRVLAGGFGGRSAEDGPTTAFTRLHAAGSGYVMPSDKDPAVRPGWGGPYAFEAMYGTCLAVAVLTEVRRGTGGEIDYSYQGYGIWMDKMQFPRVSRSDAFDLTRQTNAHPFGGNMRCSDGFANVFIIEEHQWQSMCRVIGKPEWIDDPRMANGVLRIAVQEEIDAALAEWCERHTVDEVLAAGKAANFAVGRVRKPSEVLGWEQLHTRGFFADGDTAFGQVPLAGLPFGPGLDAVPLARAPELGQNNDDVFPRSTAVPASGPPASFPRSERSGFFAERTKSMPLAGLKVLDFTWAAAGPIATSIMAYLGADIAKVEHASRPDLMRAAQKQYGYSEDDDLNSSPSFQEIGAGKRSIELNLSVPEDRAVAFRLASVADVLIENMRPGKIEKLGLSYEAVSAVNPGIVMCSQSATARVEGPGIAGYAPVFWAEGGGAWLTGWPERRPGIVRGPVDLHAAAYACLGTLAMLERRKVTGVGGYVDCSAIETVSATFGVELLEQAVTAHDGVRRGNVFPGTLINDVFPCHGTDVWIAITVRHEKDWHLLADVLGLDEPVEQATYDGIAARTARLDAYRLEGRLLQAGVPAARSLSLRSALGDARVANRGIWQFVDHEVLGRQRIIGLPWTFDGVPYDIHAGGANLGEHSEQIRKEWLGE